jgi:hypothetical protein
MMLVWGALILLTNVLLAVLSGALGTPPAVDWALRITVSGYLAIMAVLDAFLTDDDDDEKEDDDASPDD